MIFVYLLTAAIASCRDPRKFPQGPCHSCGGIGRARWPKMPCRIDYERCSWERGSISCSDLRTV